MKRNWFIKDRVSEGEFIQVCKDSNSMAEAAARLGLHFNSFKRRAEELGCYVPNKAGIGIRKQMPKTPIEDIIHKGLHPSYQSYKLKKRLFEEGIKNQECEICSLKKWRGNSISFELHHIDGDRTNHLIENLKILCPNCHSQTDTFRAKNRKN